ncbi:MFS transporter [Streptomyces liangshanensis]|uniref:MFS transporter n=1 Tax=Streptomyces liangshanensis TaxID=2717324 RepID=A0A6G9H9J3_9ACTN|nr:MFS transporter [Streptomyces liangshanensis]
MSSRFLTPRVFTSLPLAGNYTAAVTLALLALSPFLVLTTALSLFPEILMKELDASRFQLQLTSGLSNAGYAFGAVVAADLFQRLPGRHLYIFCEGGFVIASVLALSAQEIGQFMAGVILQGLFTGMLLVLALPPLILTHGVDRLPATAAVISLGLFGMVTAGPVIGGLVGSYSGWRLLYTSVAVLAAIGLTVGAMTFEPNEPPAKGARFDWTAIPLAFGATTLPFFGVSWLSRGAFGDWEFIAPVVVGVAVGALLLVSQYSKTKPLMPVRPISNTLPVTGTLNAMVVGASFTTLLELTEVYMLQVSGYSPVKTGLLIAPQIFGVVASALLFKRVMVTRWTPYMALSGLLSIVIAAAVLFALTPTNATTVVPIVAVLLGYGAGAGVVPGLFLAGFSVTAVQIGPTFALVELLRSEAAFLIGPVLVHLAMIQSSFTDGFRLALVIMLAFTAASAVLLPGLFLLGGARPEPPNLEGWMSGTSTGYHSPRIANKIRKPLPAS